MTESAYPTPDVEVPSLAPAELKDRIDAGEDVTILDTRASSDYEEWTIEGATVELVNIPYFQFLEGVDADLLDRVPRADPLVVVCGKGGASEYVAGVLAEETDIATVNLENGMNGWANVYERTEVTGNDGPATVYQYHRPSSGCLGYLVVSDGTAAVIDPLRNFTDRYLEDAEELDATLRYAFDTHIHADHLSGVRALDDVGVEGVIPEAAVPRGVTYDDVIATAADGDTFHVAEADIEAKHTPGHTSGMTSYLVGDSLLATGDGLFVESVARPDLEKGDEGAPEAARTLYKTLQERVLPLPDDTIVGGAHASSAAESAEDGTYTASLGDLVSEMDALTMAEEAFVETVLADMPPRPANYEKIIATNLGSEHVDDERAFELELGPNNCAASQDAMTGD